MCKLIIRKYIVWALVESPPPESFKHMMDKRLSRIKLHNDVGKRGQQENRHSSELFFSN